MLYTKITIAILEYINNQLLSFDIDNTPMHWKNYNGVINNNVFLNSIKDKKEYQKNNNYQLLCMYNAKKNKTDFNLIFDHIRHFRSHSVLTYILLIPEGRNSADNIMLDQLIMQFLEDNAKIQIKELILKLDEHADDEDSKSKNIYDMQNIQIAIKYINSATKSINITIILNKEFNAHSET